MSNQHTTASGVDPESYRVSHRAPSSDDVEDGTSVSLSDVMAGTVYPRDVIQHPDWYCAEYPETIAAVRAAAAAGPDHLVTIYRGVPQGVTMIHRGDWVALSHAYATRESYGVAADGSDDGHVISAQVPASVIYSEGSLEEWGYDGEHDIETDPQKLAVTIPAERRQTTPKGDERPASVNDTRRALSARIDAAVAVMPTTERGAAARSHTTSGRGR